MFYNSLGCGGATKAFRSWYANSFGVTTNLESTNHGSLVTNHYSLTAAASGAAAEWDVASV
jgi:hypothetical protein